MIIMACQIRFLPIMLICISVNIQFENWPLILDIKCTSQKYIIPALVK